MHDSRAVDPERARVRPGSVQSAGAQRLHGGSDYRTPDTAAAKIDATASKPYDRSRFESLWWKQFDDPTLNQLVEQSLSGNRDLRVAFARLRAARALRDDVANDRFPVVTSRASADIGKGQQPGVTEDRVNSERYDLGLDSAWELDLFGRIRRQLESATPSAKQPRPTCSNCRSA